jgi:hypothetical protein
MASKARFKVKNQCGKMKCCKSWEDCEHQKEHKQKSLVKAKVRREKAP